MELEKVVDAFVWGGLDVAQQLPSQPLRFLGIFVVYFIFIGTAPIWIPLALFVGFRDIWRDCAKDKGK